MTELAVPAALIDLKTGEVLEPTPENAAPLLARLREYRQDLQLAIRACEAVIIDESARTGTKTLTLGGVDLEVYGGSEVEWDHGGLRAALEDAGCPDERIDALIQQTVTFKVDRRVERQLSGANPKYAQAIEAAKTTRPAATRVRVKQ